MKNHFFILLITLPLALFGQEQNDSKWALNFANTIYTYNSSYINYYSIGDDEFDLIDSKSTKFFLSQPSIRKYQNHKITEFGIRNAGYSNEVITKNHFYLAAQFSASFTAFYSKSYRILGKKNGLYFGADLYTRAIYQNTDFMDEKAGFYNADLFSKSLTLGLNLKPSYQYNFGERFYMDFAFLVKIISYSIQRQNHFPEYNGYRSPYAEITSTDLKLWGLWIPQLSIGIKL